MHDDLLKMPEVFGLARLLSVQMISIVNRWLYVKYVSECIIDDCRQQGYTNQSVIDQIVEQKTADTEQHSTTKSLFHLKSVVQHAMSSEREIA